MKRPMPESLPIATNQGDGLLRGEPNRIALFFEDQGVRVVPGFPERGEFLLAEANQFLKGEDIRILLWDP